MPQTIKNAIVMDDYNVQILYAKQLLNIPTLKTMQMNAAEIKSMSIIERIQTMECIWDSLLYDEAVMDSPEWHQNILIERQLKIECNTAEFLSIAELQATRNQ